MTTNLTFQKIENDELTRLSLSVYKIIGRIDPETAVEFENTMRLFQKKEKNILLDFSQVAYINSFGIGILVDTQKNIVKNNGTIKICGLSESIKKIFQITYLTRVFEIYDDISQAVKSFVPKTTTV
ncbi:MAG TPA: STAS domain-containing protein [Candidatus Wallbacteria bacterium]|nr:STAS domain-containing protein [Candidatus Wallbacteria bacterium]